MDAIGGQEVTLPVVHPAELWQKSSRWYQIGDDMARFKDRNGRDMVLGMTHEEIMADMAQQIVSSYRQLPVVLYQIQTKFRDEPRPRAGLIRVREFTMKDAYTFDRDQAGLDAFYPHIYQAYFNVFRPLRPGCHRRAERHGHDGRQHGARIHGAHADRRGHDHRVRSVRLQRQPPGRHLPQAAATRRDAAAA